MNIDTAYCCIDCESLSMNPRICEYCSSLQIWPLRLWLNRKTEIETNDLFTLSMLPILSGNHEGACTCVECRNNGRRRPN